MNIKQLSKFLVKAKINTYTSSGEGGEKLLLDGSKEFEFKEGGLKYRDRYFGLNFFVGEEIVWEGGKTIWGMNYYGKIISQIVSPGQIYQFLKETLRGISENKPFRGPYRFKKDNFKYFNKTKGTVEKFEGEETIFHKRRLVYKLIYHGGIIKEK
ncbi:XRE family transcriptional regulator [Patescibacteria group bacterium]|nr:XRE family transcriptional regulator [Patescibacteria group bacterium]MBU4458822.1 XRE family transcriptional regulator [Patescibacteria group bacterium]MCG2696223.1 DUF5680 domain-containing protein [Candidatus Portnoybacteria bacterium]